MRQVLKKYLKKRRIIEKLDSQIEAATDYVLDNIEKLSFEECKRIKSELLSKMKRRNKVKRLTLFRRKK